MLDATRFRDRADFVCANCQWSYCMNIRQRLFQENVESAPEIRIFQISRKCVKYSRFFVTPLASRT